MAQVFACGYPAPFWRSFPLLEFTPHFGPTFCTHTYLETEGVILFSPKSVKCKLHPAVSKDFIGHVNHCDDAYKMLYKY